MKKRSLLTLIVVAFVVINAFAQVPQGLNFQAIARDVDGKTINATNLTIETGILSDTIANTYIWKETHAVVTNQFGLFSLVLGKGTRTAGTVATFNLINWTAAPLYIRTRVYYQSTWRDMGAANLWSVPYAMVASKSLALQGNPVMINGSEVYIMNNVGIGTDKPGTTKLAVVGDDVQSADALFEVKRKDGQVIFAVYNHGVRINLPIDTLTKAKKGGFAVGGFDDTKGFVHDYLVVNPDSIRLFFDGSPSTKAKKGGFAVGGFDDTKSSSYDLFKVNNLQIKGGREDYFQFSNFNTYLGFEAGKSSPVESETYNTLIGYRSGYSVNPTVMTYNTFIGHEAGYNSTVSTNNVFIGLRAGYSVRDVAHNNIFIGRWSGYYTTASENVFIGNSAGLLNTSGNSNVFMGTYAGNANTTGYHNLFLAANAGQQNTTGYHNLAIGAAAGGANKVGNYNVYLGSQAGAQNINSLNVMIGQQSGFNNISGTRNILIGYRAGYNEKGSNKLIVDNGLKAKPLLWGDFNRACLVVAGDSTDNQTNYTLRVVGTAAGSTVWTSLSDAKLKSSIITIPNALDKVLKLRGVNFEWNDQSLEPGKRMGFIAQEVLEIVPEVVNAEGDLMTMQYAPLTALLIEAIKEQEKKIASLEAQNELLMREMEEVRTFRAEFESMKALLLNINK